ncbi:SRPBCC family protein [Paenibacillus algicola]|uniref:SRPBCC family protein n=1 Tax=Paenibacillus algicola TaxID=2565926 RepID=UPI002D76744E|nr:SRPBCC family protein [Paenibacillus algicola]
MKSLKHKKGGGSLITLRTEIIINAPIQICFDYARDIELHTKTVWPHTRELAVDGVRFGRIGLGETVTFEANHLLVRQRLTSRIIEYEEPKRFTDEMQKGIFKSLIHRHEFIEQGGKTLMIDILRFEAPFGIVGRMAEQLLLRRYMKRFLEYRNANLKKLIEENV